MNQAVENTDYMPVGMINTCFVDEWAYDQKTKTLRLKNPTHFPQNLVKYEKDIERIIMLNFSGTMIWDDILKMKSLKHLSIYGHKFKTLPLTIHKIESLESAYIEDGPVSRIYKRPFWEKMKTLVFSWTRLMTQSEIDDKVSSDVNLLLWDE